MNKVYKPRVACKTWEYTYFWEYTLEYGEPIWKGIGGNWILRLELVS